MNILKKYFQKKGSLSSEKLKKICNIINTDPSFYNDKSYREDKIGRYYYDYKTHLKLYETSSLIRLLQLQDQLDHLI